MRVLIVEDNADVAKSLANALVALNPGYDVVWAARLDEAEAIVRKEKPDGALVDLTLPDANGCEAVIALQNVAPDLPLVALTGRDFDGIALELTRLGIQDYLEKAKTSVQRIHQVLQLAAERQQHEATWRFRACYDAVTGALTRYGIEHQLTKAMSHASRTATLGALLVFDLDDFKSVNDTHGHNTGDAVLREIVQRITAVARRGDSLGRLGGDEFALVLEGLKSAEDAAIVAHKAVEAATVPLREHGNLKVSISVGAALFPDESTDAETLIDRADKAMYEAKRNGKNAFRFSSVLPDSSRTARPEATSDGMGRVDGEGGCAHVHPKPESGGGSADPSSH